MSLPAPNTQPDTPGAREYNRVKRWLELGDLGLGLGFLVVLLATGWTSKLHDISFRVSEHYSLALLFYVFLLSVISKLLNAALDFYGFRLEHRFNLSNQRFGAWLFDEFKGWALGLIIAAGLAEIIYGLMRADSARWWIYAWIICLGLFVLFAQIAPVVLLPLFYKFVPLQNDDLKARLVRLGERAGTRVRGVYEWKLSEKSKKANAALTGLGHTRRIILADTLLENYTNDEIEAVLAHELGHHAHGHILKTIVVEAAVTLAGFWAANRVLQYAIYQRHMFLHLTDFANLPLLVLVSTLLSMLLMPALNAYSRFNERQADLYCWKSVPSVEPYISAMEKLNKQNLSESQPSRLVEVLFHSHPPVAKRIAAAQSWARKNQPSLA
ncbi:MAG TPA: M48 family metallopeptidase [Verrucomicrobiae bacterium]|jgi:STE24 endopeptidase|nr:M48 family metallopeptidase [Verrucomicrobiae bacterium]